MLRTALHGGNCDVNWCLPPPSCSPTFNMNMINQTDAVPWMTPQLWYSPRPRLEVETCIHVPHTKFISTWPILRRGTRRSLRGERNPPQHEKHSNGVMIMHIYTYVRNWCSDTNIVSCSRKMLNSCSTAVNKLQCKSLRDGHGFDRHVWLTEKTRKHFTRVSYEPTGRLVNLHTSKKKKEISSAPVLSGQLLRLQKPWLKRAAGRVGADKEFTCRTVSDWLKLKHGS